MRLRICIFCHKVGITECFRTGNELKRHVKVRHPQTTSMITAKKRELAAYRRNVLLVRARYGMDK